jgi:hypothetical protein
MWDKLAARVPALAKIIPPAAGPTATVVVKGGAGLEQAPMENRTLVAAEPPAPQAAPAPAPAAPAAAAAAAPAPVKAMPTPHLTSSLSGFDVHSAPGQTSAALDASAAASAAPDVAPAADAAAQDASAPVIAAKASYGAASRSEMMGQAAGPVYNFKGRSKKR